jgi:uridine phosphorylase
MKSQIKPHIKLEKNPHYRRAIVCGAPERASLIAERLEKPRLLAKNREYHSYLGRFGGKEVMVVSHGVGASGAAICFQELIDVGVETLIRLGTAGALQDQIPIGGIVIAESAVRRDGVSKQMIPSEFPAVASHDVVRELRSAFAASKTPHSSGMIVTADLFYPSLLDTKLKLYSKAGALAVEMECSTLFVIGALRGVRTGAVVVCDGNPLKWDEGAYDPTGKAMRESMDTAIGHCLSAIARL